MNIELRHLRYFVAVAEELHFGRAAARLNISQPPLSQQIQILEQQTGARLFARTNRSVSLTAAGKQFLADSRQILAQVEDAAARAARLHHGETGELRIGFTSSAPFIKAVSDTLSMFRQRLPDVHILTRETNTREQIVPLSEGALDLGLLRNTQLPDTLAWERVLREPLLAMVPANHPLARQPSVSLAALAPKGLYVTRPSVFVYAHGRHATQAMADDLFEVVASGKVQIHIAQRYALEEVRAAHEALEARQTTGSTILTL